MNSKIDELVKQIAETISSGIIVLDGMNGQLSRTTKIKLETLLVEFSYEIQKQTIDIIRTEYRD